MNILTRSMCTGLALVAALLVAGLPAAAQDGTPFDVPLHEIQRLTDGEVRAVIGGVGTQDGDHAITIDVPGDPLHAWVFWSGKTNADGNPDPSITVTGGALDAPYELVGVEVGRRNVIFPDEADQTGGEVVLKADLPLWALADGENTFTFSDFNERDADGQRPYREQHGIAVVVLYQVPAGEGTREVIALEGADVSNYERYHRMEGYEDQANSEVICFDFDAAECDQVATLSMAIGGVHQDVYEVPGTDRVSYGAPERTWFATGSGDHPDALIDIYSILEENKIINADFGFKGHKISVYQAQVDIPAGSTWACFQHELLPKSRTEEHYQNFVDFAATLDIDRYCEPPGECALDMSISIDPPEPEYEQMECTRRLKAITVEYTGQGCESSDNIQAILSGCQGTAGFLEPATVELVRGCGTVVGRRENVHLGDLLTFDAAEAGLDDLGALSWFRVIDPATGEVIERAKVYLDCSEKLFVGDQFGSFYLAGFTSDDGTEYSNVTDTTITYTVTNNGTADAGELTVVDDLLGEVGYVSHLAPGESATFTVDTRTWKKTRFDAVATGSAGCEASAYGVQYFAPPAENEEADGSCRGGLKKIVVSYTGENCEATTNDQDGKVVCDGDPLFAEPVTVQVLNRKGRLLKEWTDVQVADSLSLDWTELPGSPWEVGRRHKRFRPRKFRHKLPNVLVWRIMDADGNVLHEVRFNSTCRGGIAVGDRYGAIRVENLMSRRRWVW